MIITLLVLSLVIFYTTSLFPPLQRALLYISPQTYKQPGIDVFSRLDIIATKYGLYEPFYIQYANWLRVTLTEFTLGYSLVYMNWVSTAILHKIPATFELVMYSTPIIVFGGIKLGVYLGKRAHEKKGREDRIDFTIRAISTWIYSIPVFVTGTLLLSIFFLNLRWVMPGRLSPNAQSFVLTRGWQRYTDLHTIDALLNGQFWIFFDALKQLFFPVATLTISMLPIIARVTRSSILTELGKPYVTAARAKGIRNSKVISHAKKNALIPILTVSSIVFATMLTGIVVTETTFSFYGIGYMAVQAASGPDFPLLVGLAVFFCFIFVIVNFVVDILYTRIDPRISL